MTAPLVHRPDFVTVVSGIPRSGTSLLMQMLVAGGMEALRDDARAPDAHNPRGYFELEAVKATRRDASWVARAPGRVVKVIHALLPALPLSHRYRVVLVERDLLEVLASQEAMLGEAEPDALPRERLAEVFRAQLAAARDWCRSHGVPLRIVQHADVLRDPERVAESLADFLGVPLDPSAMAGAVAPELHRQRAP